MLGKSDGAALESQEKPAEEQNGRNGKSAHRNNVCDRLIMSEFPSHSCQQELGQREGRAGGVGCSGSALLLFHTKYFTFKPGSSSKMKTVHRGLLKGSVFSISSQCLVLLLVSVAISVPGRSLSSYY